MLLSHNACMIRLLNLYLMGHIGPMFGVFQALPELSGDTCTFTMTLRNFRPILSWELKNHSIVPTHYTLWYTYMSKGEDMKIVPDCTNITRSSCDVTHVWGNAAEMYLAKIVATRGDTVLVSCLGSVFPDVEMSLEPPEFEIVGFMDHINVILKFPPTLPKMPNGQGLWLHLSLIIEESSAGIVKQHRLKINGNTTGSFTYVIDKLIPNTNYCVSVYFEPKDLQTIKRSPLKCTHLQLEQEPESSESAKIGGLITMFLIASVLISTIVMLKRIGYICLRNKVPKALKFSNLPAWVFPKLPALEAVAAVEVIHINRKKKVWDYNYDDESDSDDEAVLQASAGGYTMHGLTVRPLCPVSTSSTLEDCSDPDTQETELPEPEAKCQCLIVPGCGPSKDTSGAYERRGTQVADPFPEDDSSSTESSGNRIFFGVDLNSVIVRVLDSDATEAPLVFSLPEDTVDSEDPDTTETSLLVAPGEGTQLPCPGSPVDCLGPDDAPFDKSDTFKSEVDTGDGYLIRQAPKY